MNFSPEDKNDLKAEASRLLSRLVACPSVNPAGRTSVASPYGEMRLDELLRSELDSLGARTEIQTVAEGRTNLIARFEGLRPHPTLMFEAHGDTVQADGMSVPPFEAQIRDGRLSGRGACDAKGPMAAMLLGLRRALAGAHGRLPVPVCFVSTCDEEVGAAGVRALIAGGFRVDLAVVGEPTDLAIVHVHKGALRLRIRTLGVAAHSADPSRGINAISQMRHVLEALDERLAPALQRQSHPVLGPPTLSIGTIRGGSQVNVVPDECEIEVDRRLLPGEDKARIVAGVIGELDGIRQRRPDFSFRVEESQFYPPFESPLQSPICQQLAEACRRTLGAELFRGAQWASNAGYLAEAGIPSVVFGPGSVHQAHTRDEFIALDQVARAAETYAEFIRVCAES